MKSKIINIAKWCLFAFFVMLAFGMNFSVFTVFMLLAAVGIMPIKPIKSFWNKISKGKKWVMPLIVSLAFCVAVCGVTDDTNLTEKEKTVSDIQKSVSEISSDTEKDKKDKAGNEKSKDEENISNTSSASEAENSSDNSSSDKSNVSSEQAHVHSYSKATCTAPATCSCGAVKGTPTGHNWKEATYTSPKKCTACGVTEGSALEKPGGENYHGHVYTGGNNSVKFHYESNCAGKNSHEITWEEVERRNLTPCGTCVLK